MLGKCQGDLIFFKPMEFLGNSVMFEGKMSGKCQRILHFSLIKLGCLVPMYFSC